MRQVNKFRRSCHRSTCRIAWRSESWTCLFPKSQSEIVNAVQCTTGVVARSHRGPDHPRARSPDSGRHHKSCGGVKTTAAHEKPTEDQIMQVPFSSVRRTSWEDVHFKPEELAQNRTNEQIVVGPLPQCESHCSKRKNVFNSFQTFFFCSCKEN